MCGNKGLEHKINQSINLKFLLGTGNGDIGEQKWESLLGKKE